MELEEGNALCRKEAAWVFLNLCECGRDTHRSIIPDMVQSGVISAVCQNLNTDSDAGKQKLTKTGRGGGVNRH